MDSAVIVEVMFNAQRSMINAQRVTGCKLNIERLKLKIEHCPQELSVTTKRPKEVSGVLKRNVHCLYQD
jgi:hypothetical protein